MPGKQPQLSYSPRDIPLLKPDETIPDYLKRLQSFLAEELNSIQEQFDKGVAIQTEREPPRSPFDGMVKYFNPDIGWVPKVDESGNEAPSGYYVYHDGFWYRFQMVNFAYLHL